MIRTALLLIAFLSFVSYSQCPHDHSSPASHESHVTPTAKTAVTPLSAQTKCPIMGNTIDHSIATVWEGDENHTPKKVYFCCPMCIDKFKKNPVKYIKKLEKMKQPIENVIVEQEKE